MEGVSDIPIPNIDPAGLYLVQLGAGSQGQQSLGSHTWPRTS